MDLVKPLFWHQGLFLQPQHFQLLDQGHHAQLASLLSLSAPHAWGVNELEVKKAALNVRSFGVLHGRFLFSDGTYVQVPGNAVLEDRSFEDAWMDGGKPLTVYVGLKKWTPDSENVTVVKKGESPSDAATRFVASPDPEDVKDLHAGGPAGQVKRMTHLLKIFWDSELDHLGDYTLLPVAQLERVGAEVSLAERFIPPCVSVSGSETLVALVKEIGDQLLSRSRQLEEHKSQRGMHTAEFGSRDMVYLLALRSINRYLPWFRHYSEVTQIHPWHLYGILRQIVGDLSCFSEGINVMGEDPDDEERSLPAYDHLHLWRCFSTAQELIVQMMANITAGPDYMVKLDLQDNVYATELKPSIFDANSRFFLALTTDEDPKKAIQAMDTVVKVSSRSQLGRLISHALPGVPVEHLSAPPQELPRRRNVLYFAIDHHHEHWTHVKKERAIAVSWEGAPPGQQIELMAVAR